MRKFFKYVFASMLGFIIAGGVLLVLFVGILLGLMSNIEGQFESKGKDVSIKKNSVYHLKFSGKIDERSNDNPFEGIDFGPFSEESGMSLRNLVQSIEYAATDDNIRGIFIELRGFPGGLSTLEEVRNALMKFRESDKWIITYSEEMTQSAYYLASVSDKIYLFPSGEIYFKGLASKIMFLKGMLDKLDIEMQAIKGPDNIYKSAVEPMTRSKMSDPNREQISRLLGSVWTHWLQGISENRGISVDDLNRYADSLLVRNAEMAKKLGFVDDLKYYDEVISEIVNRVGVEDEDDVNFVKYSKMKKKKVKTYQDIKDKKIAVVFANGEIRSGKSRDGVMGSTSIVKAIKKARLDTNVKAIVLRVNSPGGSALASDVMWRETVLAKLEKPFIVSMGDLAASGGYFISCSADKIYATETTITGSIGVFGLMPVTGKFFKNKLGIEFDGVSTNTHSDFMNGVDKLDEEEYEVVNQAVIEIYNDFVSKVAEGRHMTPDEVNEVARGRVWTGLDAKRIGLVDDIGTLNDAIAYAADEAGLESYKVKELPEKRDPFEELLKSIQEDMMVRYMKDNFGNVFSYLEILDDVDKMSGVQARIPYHVEIY